MKITDALVAEHRAFSGVFAHGDRLLEELQSAPEIHALARLFVTLLHDHGDTEQNLAFTALDHVLADRGPIDRLYQEHHEVDLRFREVLEATELAQARDLLKSALRATRDHFAWEEQAVFPVLEQVLSGDALRRLGEAHAHAAVESA